MFLVAVREIQFLFSLSYISNDSLISLIVSSESLTAYLLLLFDLSPTFFWSKTYARFIFKILIKLNMN